VRFGADRLVALPDFMDLFREAERRVQARAPRLRAEAIGYLEVSEDAERLRAEEQKLSACLRAARDGFGGIDLEVRPYDATGDPTSRSSVVRTLTCKGVVRIDQMYPNTGGKAMTTIAAHTAKTHR
jgi:hypothetical protein